MPDFTIRQGDRLPIIEAKLVDEDDAAVNLTGATVRFIMRPKYQSTVKVNAAATIVAPVTGDVKYEWLAVDTDTPGSYWAEWEVKFADTRTATFPNGDHIDIEVFEQLGSAP